MYRSLEKFTVKIFHVKKFVLKYSSLFEQPTKIIYDEFLPLGILKFSSQYVLLVPLHYFQLQETSKHYCKCKCVSV